MLPKEINAIICFGEGSSTFNLYHMRLKSPLDIDLKTKTKFKKLKKNENQEAFSDMLIKIVKSS